MTTRIVSMEEHHLDSVKAIEQSCFPIPWDGEVFDMLARWRGRILLEGGRLIRMAIAEENRETAGYIVWEENRLSLKGRIMNIAVRDSSRRKGIGRVLLIYALKSQKSNGMKLCELEVRESNSHAQRLYESVDMKESGRVPGYYETEDAIIYSINL